jgi:hypothetical protein
VELATAVETASGSVNTLAVHPAGFKSALTPEAWIAPTLVNTWSNIGLGSEVAGYRKLYWGEVQLKGVLAGGTATNGTVIFTLPVGYRPPLIKHFVALQGGNAACRVIVGADGEVSIWGVTNNALLSLEGIRFSSV